MVKKLVCKCGVKIVLLCLELYFDNIFNYNENISSSNCILLNSLEREIISVKKLVCKCGVKIVLLCLELYFDNIFNYNENISSSNCILLNSLEREIISVKIIKFIPICVGNCLNTAYKKNIN